MSARATYRFAVATAVATFLLLLVGGLVNPTGSSLACPDWPLCFGSAFPEMVGGILYEHSHRLLATGVGIMTIVLAVLLYRLRDQDQALGKLGFTALAMIVVQGVLGGLTVLLKLPPQISIAHLALSMVFFLYLVYVAVRVRRLVAPQQPVAVPASARRWLVIAFVLVYAQIVLGAVVRHTHAALSCLNEIPLCFGQVFPEHAHYTAHIHMAHRLLGVVVGLAVFYAAARAWSSLSGRARLIAAAAPLLVVLQIVLGIYTVLTMKSLVVVEAHLAVGVALLAAMALLVLGTRRGAAHAAAADEKRGKSGFGAIISLTKPRISILSVATAAVGMAVAPGHPSRALLLTTLLGTLLLVSSANTLNMYLEREVDASMARTRRRPLPSGRLAAPVALWFGVLQALVAIPLLTFCANALTGLLGAIALVLYVLVYTPLKQHSVHALEIGAIPGAMPPLLGWTAVTGSLSSAGLALFTIMFFWQIPHFLAIAMFQGEDYRKAGLKVFPVERGEPAARRVIVYYLLLQVLVTLLLVPIGVGGAVYLAGAAVLGAVMLGFGFYGLAKQSGRNWARGLFLVSIAYLPLLFALMVAS